jgi:hypothetical protein
MRQGDLGKDKYEIGINILGIPLFFGMMFIFFGFIDPRDLIHSIIRIALGSIILIITIYFLIKLDRKYRE